MRTIRFKAENFEAEATEAEPLAWIIRSPGNSSHSLRRAEKVDEFAVLTSVGWVPLCKARTLRSPMHSLAVAISLLYSVPGVEPCE
jgi:hypothetical protein